MANGDPKKPELAPGGRSILNRADGALIEATKKPIPSSSRRLSPYGGPTAAYPTELALEFNFPIQPHMDFEQMSDLRADLQPTGQKFRHSLMQTATTLVGQTLESIGGILSIPEMVANIWTGEHEFDNWFAQTGAEMIQGGQERYPIYARDPEKFDPLSADWWFQNGPQLVSTLAIMLPGLGAAKIAGRIGRAAGLARNMSKSKQALWFAGGASFFQRTGESYMEGISTFEQVYQKSLQDGYNDETARQRAAKAASKVYYSNLSLMAVDFVQNLTLFAGMKSFSGLKKNKGLFGLGYDKWYYQLPFQMATEAGEEGVQYLFQKEAERSLEDGKNYFGKGFGLRLVDYVRDDEFKTSVALGAIGGGVFSGIGTLISDKVFRSGKEDIEDMLLREDLEKYSNNPDVLHDIQDANFLSRAFQLANRGELWKLADSLEEAGKISDAELEKAGIDREAWDSTLKRHQDNIEAADKIFNEIVDMDIHPAVQQEYFMAKTGKYLAARELGVLEQDIKNILETHYDSLTPQAQEEKKNYYHHLLASQQKGRNKNQKKAIDSRVAELKKLERNQGQIGVAEMDLMSKIMAYEHRMMESVDFQNIINELGTEKGRADVIQKEKERREERQKAQERAKTDISSAQRTKNKEGGDRSITTPPTNVEEDDLGDLEAHLEAYNKLPLSKRNAIQGGTEDNIHFNAIQKALKKGLVQVTGSEAVELAPGIPASVEVFGLASTSTEDATVAPLRQKLVDLMSTVDSPTKFQNAINYNLTDEEEAIIAKTPSLQQILKEKLEQFYDTKSADAAEIAKALVESENANKGQDLSDQGDELVSSSLQPSPGDIFLSEEDARKLLNYMEKKYGIENVLDTIVTKRELGWFDRVSQRVFVRMRQEGVSKNTIIHEYLHPFVDIIREFNPALYASAVSQATQANERDNFFDPSNYNESEQSDEVLVRYLVQLHINPKKRAKTIWQRIWDWLTQFFHSLRSYNAADIRKLSSDTTVEELYEIFDNYGTLSKDSALATARMKSKIQIDRINAMLQRADLSDDLRRELQLERDDLSYDLIAFAKDPGTVRDELSRIADELAALREVIKRLELGALAHSKSARAVENTSPQMDEIQVALATPTHSAVESTSSERTKVIKAGGVTTTYVFKDHIKAEPGYQSELFEPAATLDGKMFEDVTALGDFFENVPEDTYTALGPSVTLLEYTKQPAKSKVPSTLLVRTDEGENVTIELEKAPAQSYFIPDADLYGMVQRWNMMTKDTRLRAFKAYQIGDTAADNVAFLDALIKAAKDNRITATPAVENLNGENITTYTFSHPQSSDARDTEIVIPATGEVFKQGKRELIFLMTVSEQGTPFYVFYNRNQRSEEVRISPENFQRQINTGEITRTGEIDEKVIQESGWRDQYTDSTDAVVEDISEELESKLSKHVGEVTGTYTLYAYGRAPQAFGKAAYKTAEFEEGVETGGATNVRTRTNISQAIFDPGVPYKKILEPGHLEKGTPIYFRPIEDPDQMINYKGEPTPWGVVKAELEAAGDYTGLIDHQPIGAYSMIDSKETLVFWHHDTSWVNESNVYGDLITDKLLVRESKKFIINNYLPQNGRQVTNSKITAKVVPLLMKHPDGWDPDRRLISMFPGKDYQVSIFARGNFRPESPEGLINNPLKEFKEGLTYVIIPTPSQGKVVALPVKKVKIPTEIARSITEAVRAYVYQEHTDFSRFVEEHQGLDLTNFNDIKTYVSMFVYNSIPSKEIEKSWDSEKFSSPLGHMAYGMPSDLYMINLTPRGIAFASGSQNMAENEEGKRDRNLTFDTPEEYKTKEGNTVNLKEILLDELSNHLTNMYINVNEEHLESDTGNISLFDESTGATLAENSYREYIKNFLYSDVMGRPYINEDGETKFAHWTQPFVFYDTSYLGELGEGDVFYFSHNQPSGSSGAKNKLVRTSDGFVTYFLEKGAWIELSPESNRHKEIVMLYNEFYNKGSENIVKEKTEPPKEPNKVDPEYSEVTYKKDVPYFKGKNMTTTRHYFRPSEEMADNLGKDQESFDLIMSMGTLKNLMDVFDEAISLGATHIFYEFKETGGIEYDLWFDRLRKATLEARDVLNDLNLTEGVDTESSLYNNARIRYQNLQRVLNQQAKITNEDLQAFEEYASLDNYYEDTREDGWKYKTLFNGWTLTWNAQDKEWYTTSGKKISVNMLVKLKKELGERAVERRKEIEYRKRKTQEKLDEAIKEAKKAAGEHTPEPDNSSARTSSSDEAGFDAEERLRRDMEDEGIGWFFPVGPNDLEEQFSSQEVTDEEIRRTLQQDMDSEMLYPGFELWQQNQIINGLAERMVWKFIKEGDQASIKKFEKKQRQEVHDALTKRLSRLRTVMIEWRTKAKQAEDPLIASKYLQGVTRLMKIEEQIESMLSEKGWTFFINKTNELISRRAGSIQKKIMAAEFEERFIDDEDSPGHEIAKHYTEFGDLSRDPYESVNARVKLMLSFLTKKERDRNGNLRPMQTYLRVNGLYQYEDPQEIYGKLLKFFHDTPTDYNQILSKLEDVKRMLEGDLESTGEVDYEDLYYNSNLTRDEINTFRRLQGEQKIFGAGDVNWVTTLLDKLKNGGYDQSFKNAFAVALTKAPIVMQHLNYKPDGKFYKMEIRYDDTSALSRGVRKKWASNLRTKTREGDLLYIEDRTYYVNKEKAEQLIGEINKMRNYWNAFIFQNRNKRDWPNIKKEWFAHVQENGGAETLQSFFSDIGVELPLRIVYQMMKGHRFNEGRHPRGGITHGPERRRWTWGDLMKDAEGGSVFTDIQNHLETVVNSPDPVPLDDLDLHDSRMLATLSWLVSAQTREGVNPSFYSGSDLVASNGERRYIYDRERALTDPETGVADRLLESPYSKYAPSLRFLKSPADNKKSLIAHEYYKSEFNVRVMSLKAMRKAWGDYNIGKYNKMDRNNMEVLRVGFYSGSQKKPLKTLGRDENKKPLRLTRYFFSTTSEKPVGFHIGGIARDIPTKGLNLTEGAVNTFMDIVLKAEFSRIYAYQNRDTDHKAFNKGKRLIFSIPELNSHDSGIWTDNHMLKEGFLENDSWVNSANLNRVKDIVRNHLEKRINDKIKHWEQIGIYGEEKQFFPKQYYGSYISQGVAVKKVIDPDSETIQVKTVKDVDVDVQDAKRFAVAADYVVNYMIANYEFSALFWGDPAQYYKMSEDNRITQNALAEKNIPYDFASEGYDYLSDIISTMDNAIKRLAADVAPGRSQSLLDGKRTINTAYANDRMVDSLSLDFYKSIGATEDDLMAYKNMTGTDAIVYVTAPEYLYYKYSDGEISQELYEDALLLFREKGKLPQEVLETIEFGSLKPVYVQNVFRDDMEVRKYIKMSVVPLIEELTREFEIDKLRQTMEKQGLDMLVFDSAYKVGMPGDPANIWLYEKGEYKDNIWVPSEEDPITAKEYNELTVAEQKSYKQSTVIDPNLDLKPHSEILPREGLKIQQDINFKEETEGGKNVEILVSSQNKKNIFVDHWDDNMDLAKKYHTIYNTLYRQQYDTFMDRIIDKKSGQIRLSTFAKELRREGLERNYNYNELAALHTVNTKDGVRFRAPLWATSSRKRIESLIMSLIDAKVRKVMFKGNSYTLVSEEGFQRRGIHKWEKYLEKNVPYSDIVYTPAWDGESLKHTRMKDGQIKSTQVFVRWPFGSHISLDKVTKPDPKNPKRRIIDTKMIPEKFLQAYGFRIPNQGINSSAAIEIAGFLPESYSVPIVASRDFLTQMGSDYDIDKLYMYFYDVGYGGLFGVDKFYDPKTAHNQILDIHIELMKRPGMQKKIMRPMVITDFKEAFVGKRDANGDWITKGPITLREEQTGRDISPFSPDYMQDKYYDAQQGQNGTGIFASATVMHATFQAARHMTDTGEGAPVDIAFRSLAAAPLKLGGQTSKGKLGLIKLPGDSMTIADKINQFLSAMVDNENEGNLAGRGNLNRHTFPVAKLLVYLGFKLDTVANFINQPAIFDFIEEFTALSSPTAGYISNRRETAFQNVMARYERLGKLDSYERGLKDHIKEKINKHSLESLYNDIIPATRDSAFYYRQKQILLKYRNLLTQSAHLGNIETTLNTDSQGPGKSVMTAMQKYSVIQALGKDDMIQDLEYVVGEYRYLNEPLDLNNLEKKWKGYVPFGSMQVETDTGRYVTKFLYIKPTTIAGMTNTYTLAAVKETIMSESERKDNAKIKPLFPYSSDELKQMFSRLEEDTGMDTQNINERIRFKEEVFDHYKAYRYTAPDIGLIPTDPESMRYQLLIDSGSNFSLAFKLQHVSSDPNFTKNSFLKSLGFELNTDLSPSTITFDAAGSQEFDKNNITADFMRLFTDPVTFRSHPNDPFQFELDSRDVGMMLAQYAYIVHGGRQLGIEFTRYVPVALMNALGTFDALHAINWNKRDYNKKYERQESKLSPHLFEKQYKQHYPWKLPDFTQAFADALGLNLENKKLKIPETIIYEGEETPDMVSTRFRGEWQIYEYNPQKDTYHRQDVLGSIGVKEFNYSGQSQSIYPKQQAATPPLSLRYEIPEKQKYRATYVPTHQKNIIDAYPLDNVYGALEGIVLSSQNEGHKEMAQWFQVMMQKSNIQLNLKRNDDIRMPNGKKSKGVTRYTSDPKSGIDLEVSGMRVDGGAHDSAIDLEVTLLHEVAHGFTQNLVDDYQKGNLSPEMNKHFKQLEATQKALIQYLRSKYEIKGYEQLMSNLTSDNYYLAAGMDAKLGGSLQEFVAILMTSKELQDILNNEIWVNPKGDKSPDSKTWWDYVVKIFLAIFRRAGIEISRGDRLGDEAVQSIKAVIRLASDESYYYANDHALPVDEIPTSRGTATIKKILFPSGRRKYPGFRMGKIEGLEGVSHDFVLKNHQWIDRKGKPVNRNTLAEWAGRQITEDMEEFARNYEGARETIKNLYIQDFKIKWTQRVDLHFPVALGDWKSFKERAEAERFRKVDLRRYGMRVGEIISEDGMFRYEIKPPVEFFRPDAVNKEPDKRKFPKYIIRANFRKRKEELEKQLEYNEMRIDRARSPEEEKRLRQAQLRIEESIQKIDQLTKKARRWVKMETISDVLQARLGYIKEWLKKPLTIEESMIIKNELMFIYQMGQIEEGFKHVLFNEIQASNEELMQPFVMMAAQAQNVLAGMQDSLNAQLSQRVSEELGRPITQEDLLGPLKDITQAMSHYENPGRFGDLLAGVLDKWYKKTNARAQREFDEVIEEYQRLHKAALPELKRLQRTPGSNFYDVLLEKSPDGDLTGRMIAPTTQYYNEQRVDYSIKFNSSLPKKRRFWNWMRNEHWNLDANILFGDKQNEKAAYEAKMISRIGSYQYNFLKGLLEKRVKDYEVAYERRKEMYDERPEYTPKQRKDYLRRWEIQNSPFELARVWEGDAAPPNIATFNNRFIVVAPKREVNGKDTGYYNPDFAAVQNSPDVLKFYDFFIKHMVTGRNSLPGYIRRRMSTTVGGSVPRNFLPWYQPNIGQELLSTGSNLSLRGKGILERLKDDFKEGIRDTDISTDPVDYMDPTTGKKRYNMSADVGENQAQKVHRQKQILYIQFRQELADLTEDRVGAFMKKWTLDDLDVYENKYKKGQISFEFLKNWFTVTEQKVDGDIQLTFKNSRTGNMRMRYLAEEAVAESKSYDLTYIFYRFVKSTQRLKHRIEKEALMDVGFNAMHNRIITHVNQLGMERGARSEVGAQSNVGEAIDFLERRFKNAPDSEYIGTIRKTPILTKDEKEQQAKLDKLMEEATDGERQILEKQKSELGGVISGKSAAQGAMRLTHLIGLGWNLKSALMNFNVGQLANLIEASKGTEFTMKEFKQAWGSVLQLMGHVGTFKAIDSPRARKIMNIMMKNDFVKDSTSEVEKAKQASDLAKYKKENFLHPFHLMQRAELMNQSILIESMLRHKKAKDFSKTYTGDASLYEAITEEGVWDEKNFGELDITAWDEFKLMGDEKIIEVHGNYDPDSSLLARGKIATQVLGQYKRWAIEAFQIRFEKEKEDLILGRKRKGRWRSAWDALMGHEGTYNEGAMGWGEFLLFFGKQLVRKMLFQKTEFDKHLTQLDAANLRAFSTELMLWGMLWASIHIISRLGDDDDEMSAMEIFALNTLMRAVGEMQLFADPRQWIQQSESLLPVAFTMKKVIDASGGVINLAKSPWEEDYDRGWKDAKKVGSAIPVVAPTISMYNQFENVVGQQ